MLTFSFSVIAQSQPVKKSDLKVLYVGHHPDGPDRYYFGGNLDTWKATKKERSAEFMKLFNTYFKDVTLVYGDDYKESMSDAYDVTIFDAIIPQADGTLSEGMPSRGEPYLSKDYDAATVFIAGPAGPLLDDRNSKINTLCNCLDSHAYYTNPNHPVFNSPYKVDMTTEMRAPNRGVYGYYTAKNLPEKLPMLRMQNVDHLEGYPPGIVSSPMFDDSPDAETIASGPSIKMVEAVSIGRHGNLFQWGYRADPRHLTQSGKLALINSIHYIAQFKGQKPFVERTKQNRLSALDKIYKASNKGFDYQLKFYQRLHDRYNEAKARSLAGKSTKWDKMTLSRETKFPDRVSYLKDVPKEVIKKNLDDWDAYLSYYEDNKGYLGLSEVKEREGSGFKYQDIIIDTDLQKLKVANNDIALLDACINMLETNDQPELAQKLLTKYTTESFTTAKQWKKWLKKNRDKLFFTETGGYKWMVNQIK
jgi:hypothetical protein